jgi:Mg2+-importing ATPase
MIVFGLVSTVFDLMTFGILRWLFDADATLLRSGWFVESTFSELAVMLVLRTRRKFWRSMPSNALLAASISVGVVTLVLPYSPLSSNLALQSLPGNVLMGMFGVTILYVFATETLKRKTPQLLFTREEFG